MSAQLESYLKILDLCRMSLAASGADSPVIIAALAEIAEIVRGHEQQIETAIEDLLTSVPRDRAQHQREVGQAIVDLAVALEAGPANQEQAEACFATLAHLLGSVERALGVVDALHVLCWTPRFDAGGDSGGSGPVLAA